MNLCFVIGNGFDLDLGLKSKYKDFFESEEFREIISYKSHVNRRHSELMEHLSQKNHEKWIDLEGELKLYAENIYEKANLSMFSISLKDHYGNTTEDRIFFELLENALSNYLGRIESNFNPNRDSYAYLLFKKLVDRATLFSSFDIMNYNYTSLPINLKTNCSLFYVHGCINNRDIIIGISDDCKVRHQHSFLIKSHNKHYKSQNVREKLNMADIVIFFGHSLGESDYHYFQQFFSRQSSSNSLTIEKKKMIYIFTYDEASRLDILWELRKMNNNNVNLLYDQNIFDVIAVKDIDVNCHLDSILSSIDKFLPKRNKSGISIIN